MGNRDADQGDESWSHSSLRPRPFAGGFGTDGRRTGNLTGGGRLSPGGCVRGPLCGGHSGRPVCDSDAWNVERRAWSVKRRALHSICNNPWLYACTNLLLGEKLIQVI